MKVAAAAAEVLEMSAYPKHWLKLRRVRMTSRLRVRWPLSREQRLWARQARERDSMLELLCARGRATLRDITPQYYVARSRHHIHFGGAFEGPFLDPDTHHWASVVRALLNYDDAQLDKLRRDHLTDAEYETVLAEEQAQAIHGI